MDLTLVNIPTFFSSNVTNSGPSLGGSCRLLQVNPKTGAKPMGSMEIVAIYPGESVCDGPNFVLPLLRILPGKGKNTVE